MGTGRGLPEQRTRGAKLMLNRLGTHRWGKPDARQQELMDQVSDLAELERMIDRLFDADSWESLLADLKKR